jgi:hypothetical protein
MFLLFSSIAAGLVGCETKSCNEIGCDVPVTVEFGTQLPTGEYRVTVETRDQARLCVVAVDGDGGLSEENDCADREMKPNGQRLVLYDDPGWIKLKITHLSSGATIESRLDFEYTTTHPNGKDCPSECRNVRSLLDTSDLAESVSAYEAAGVGGAGGGNTTGSAGSSR